MDQLCKDAASHSYGEQAEGKPQQVLKKRTSEVVQQETGRRLHFQLLAAMEDVDFTEADSWCFGHGKRCKIPDAKHWAPAAPKAISLAVAGISCVSTNFMAAFFFLFCSELYPLSYLTCEKLPVCEAMANCIIELNLGLDWSSMGSRQGLVGKGVQANAMWVKERQTKKEQVIIVECTSQFAEADAVTSSLEGLYDFQCVILGPDDFGLPATRQRKFTVGILRSWGHVDASLSDIGRGFRVRRTCGDIYLVAPEADIVQHLASRAKDRGFSQDLARACQACDLLPPAMAVRRENYKVQLERQKLAVGLCMLGQNAESFGCVRESVPALLRTSTVWCFNSVRERELLAKEHLVVMGLPAYPALASRVGYQCPFRSILDGPDAISPAQVKSLAGNSIVVPVFGYLVTFVLAHLCPGSVGQNVSDDVGGES